MKMYLVGEMDPKLEEMFLLLQVVTSGSRTGCCCYKI